MTPGLSLLVEIPPYEDPVGSIAGLRCRGVELVVATAERRMGGWPGVVRVEPGPGALDRALAAATAPVVAVADSGSSFDAGALPVLLDTVHDGAGTGVVYTDERIAGVEVRKPDWSPAFLGHFDYVGRLTLVPRSLALEAGGFDGAGPAALHRFRLRVSGAGVPVRHVARIAYERPRDDAPSLLAMRDDRAAPAATVSVLLPTAGTIALDGRKPYHLALRALDAVRRASVGMAVEVVVVVGPEVDPAVVDALLAAGDGLVRIVRDPEPFNFSRRMNLGAAASESDVLVWLNDDVERNTRDDWLAAMVELAALDDVGAVGGKLLYPDSTVQTVGVRFLEGLPKHVGVGAAPELPGPLRSFIAPREQSAVTGAVLATRSAVYDEVGGLTDTLPVNFGDIDYCLKVRSRGYRVVLTPRATLRHYESASRPHSVEHAEVLKLVERWPGVEDPYWPWPDEADRHSRAQLNGSPG